MLARTSYVPKWMVEKVNADNSQRSSISFVNIPYATISDSAVKVTDAEIVKYVNDHKEEYKQEESRGIEYVTFNAAPSKNDSLEIYNQLVSLKNEFATTPDPAAFLLRAGSETPFFDGFVLKSKMQVSASDSIQQLQDNQVVGPYLDGGNYVVAKMIGRRSMPDSVKSRHILIKFAERGAPVRADSAAKKLIDSIETAIRNGANFDSMVVKFSEDEGSKAKGGEYEFTSLQFGNLSREFAETIFYGNAGFFSKKEDIVRKSSGTSAYSSVFAEPGFVD